MPIISFSCLITEARTSGTMLNRNGESCILVLLLILEKKISFSPFSIMSAVDLQQVVFIIMSHALFIPNMLTVFIMDVNSSQNIYLYLLT